ncbi:helix-turn-helix domain-containing protein [Streptomyces sp. NPDC059564]|uniref:helix-turn-helix domain-containing protein n=1 Tax=Streptomyces sp. NPDC059564 TaxID=3346865 RepID=UPI003675D7C5
MDSAIGTVAVSPHHHEPDDKGGAAEERWPDTPAQGLTERERAVWRLLADTATEACEPAARLAAEANEIVAMIRAAITYRTYTRTQPLTASQIADDLGARLVPAAAALKLLYREEILDRSSAGGLYWVRDAQDLPGRSAEWAVEQVAIQLATGRHSTGSTFRVDLAAVLLKTTSSDLSGRLLRRGLLRNEDGRWVVTGNVARLPRPPRIPAPVPRARPFTRQEIVEAVTLLRHDPRRSPGPARAGREAWLLLRAMAAQLQAAAPPASSGEEAFVRAALAVLAQVPAPLESAARRWLLASLATAVDAALTAVPEDIPPTADTSGNGLTPLPKGRRLTGAKRHQVATQITHAYNTQKMRVDEIAEATGLSISTVYDLLREAWTPLRERGTAQQESRGPR